MSLKGLSSWIRSWVFAELFQLLRIQCAIQEGCSTLYHTMLDLKTNVVIHQLLYYFQIVFFCNARSNSSMKFLKDIRNFMRLPSLPVIFSHSIHLHLLWLFLSLSHPFTSRQITERYPWPCGFRTHNPSNWAAADLCPKTARPLASAPYSKFPNIQLTFPALHARRFFPENRNRALFQTQRLSLRHIP